MMFADDIVICSESREQVEESLERWRFALERRGMKVSRSKTEYMCANEREGSGTVRLQGEEVKKVQEFKYLGSTVQSNGECEKEVKKRVQAGWKGWRKVSGVLCDRKISARIKGKVYRTVMRPAMLYGLETVSLRKRQESELEVAELKMLRFSLGVTRLDRIRNEYIRGTAHVGRLGDKVREARLRWFGHVQRRENVHSISWQFLGSEGISLPIYTERITVNDVTVFYYDSNMKSTTPYPEWLNTTAGQQHWEETTALSHSNRAEMTSALEKAKQYNLSGTYSGTNIYQGYSRCDLYANGTIKSMLTHALNGKDFLSLDIYNKRFIASVPKAHIYKRIREENEARLERMVFFYKETCFDRLRMFLGHSPHVNRTNAPDVRLFERHRAGSTLLTCHVTGFYPRAVQVKWIGADLQLVDDEMNDVLPNGDGTYQTRRSVIKPEESTEDQQYSCVVHHSSSEENIAVTWGKEQKRNRLPVQITLGCIFMVCVVGLLIRGSRQS
ncbi:hypothetical protein QTP86_034717 [Hemibagrus guttatus]|nr:hypothetical protein QTP86_034717 [Hemibagrus guttatus]